MDMMMFQIALLLLVAFIIGCILGCWLKRLFAAESVPAMVQPIEKPAEKPTKPVSAAVAASDPAIADIKATPKSAPKAASKPAAKPKAKAASRPATPKPSPAKAKAAAPEGEIIDVGASAALPGSQPMGFRKALDGKADDLKRIRGIGKVNEKKLNDLGIWHFSQIAKWKKAEVEWVDAFIAFNGRIAREDWVGQAKTLAKGGDTAFSKRVDKGQVSSSSGGAPKKPKS